MRVHRAAGSLDPRFRGLDCVDVELVYFSNFRKKTECGPSRYLNFSALFTSNSAENSNKAWIFYIPCAAILIIFNFQFSILFKFEFLHSDSWKVCNFAKHEGILYLL